jgi:hypothetical protein
LTTVDERVERSAIEFEKRLEFCPPTPPSRPGKAGSTVLRKSMLLRNT